MGYVCPDCRPVLSPSYGACGHTVGKPPLRPVPTYFVIRPNVEPIGGGRRVSAADIEAEIDRLSGRSIGRYILARAIPNTYRGGSGNRAYVACAKGSPWREENQNKAGFIVEKVGT